MKIDYQKICKDCLKGLDQRTFDVIQRRFGLKSRNKETLEAIGASYEITRERVRQIELEGLAKVRKDLAKKQELANHFDKAFNGFGKVKREADLLQTLGDKSENQVSFLLANIAGFDKFPEDNNFHSFWVNNKEVVNKAKNVVKLTIKRLKKNNKTLCLDDLLKGEKLKKDIFVSYIGISKNIEKNPEGEFGLAKWIEINPKGVKDRAYLVFKREEKPLHFADLASMIEKLPFPGPKKVHTATVHNELIKDPRFVLVGRGLYALKEWGYQSGIVKDVIAQILKDSKKPLSKDEILKKVLEQRFVKENTIVLNLQDKSYFLRNIQGKYTIKKA
jgi:hypothetical protein